MSEFTSGPWTVKPPKSEHDNIRVRDSEHFTIALITGGLDDEPSPLLNGPTSVANAHVIAAAPDLYAALKLIVEHFGDPLKVAHAALDKAEGVSDVAAVTKG